MAAAGGADVKPSETQVFGTLKIERRVLETPSRTIAIRSIASISVGTVQEARTLAPLLFAAALAFGALNLGLTRNASWQTVPNEASIALLVAAALLVAYWLRPNDPTHYLIVATNDGSRTLFNGPHRETLDEVRGLLALKINESDEQTTYNINFQNGTIENLTTGGLTAQTMVHGDNNQVALHSPGARVGSPGGDAVVSNSAGVQIGHGHAAGNSHNQVTVVDFGGVLPTIEQLRDYYAHHPDQLEIKGKLDEIASLMRSGSAYPHEKARVRSLAADLSTVLQGYPSLVQLFQHIRALTGL